MTTVKAYGAEAAFAVGTTLVAGAVKAGQEFANAAIEAGRFSDATGLSIEDASRWISVADDLGLSADDVQKSFLRLNKEIGEGGGVAEQYGISLQKTADGAADVNATMLTAIERINGIKDPTERARVAQELFGRSYANVAELLFENAEKVRKALESTSDAQVFTDDEREKAEQYRAAMDQLGDVLTDLKYTVGEEVVPALSDLATSLVKVDDATRKVTGGQRGLFSAIGDTVSNILMGNQAGREAADILWGQADAAEGARKFLKKWAEQALVNAEAAAEEAAANELATLSQLDHARAANHTATALGENNRQLDRLRGFADRAADYVKKLGTEWDRLKGKLSDESAYLDAMQAFEDIGAEAQAALDAGTDATLDQKRALVDLKLAVGNYLVEVGKVPPSVATRIVANMDQAGIANIQALIASWTTPHTLPLVPRVISTGGSSSVRVDEFGNVRGYDTGGVVPGPKGSPQLALVHGGETILPTHKGDTAVARATSAGGDLHVTINFAEGPRDVDQFARQVRQALEREMRWNGPLKGWT